MDSEGSKTMAVDSGRRLALFLKETFPGLSEHAMSKTFGFPNTTVREWLRGRRIPQKAIMRLQELGCNIPWLLTGQSEPVEVALNLHSTRMAKVILQRAAHINVLFAQLVLDIDSNRIPYHDGVYILDKIEKLLAEYSREINTEE